MSRWARFALNSALIAVLLVFGAPFLWIAALAFDRTTGAAWPWPQEPTFDNARQLFTEFEIGAALRNSVIVSAGVAALSVAVAALAGYGLSRAPWRGKSAVAYGLLLLYSFPFVATMTPINDLARRLDLFNTHLGLILAQTAVVLPLSIWLMKGSFDAIPPSLQEAAEVDGGTELHAWLNVLLPLIRPALAVVFGLSFAISWADFVLATALIRGQSMATVSLRFASGAQGGMDAPVVAALGLISIAPVLAIFMALRRSILRGFESAYSA